MTLLLLKLKVSSPIAAGTWLIGGVSDKQASTSFTLDRPIYIYEMVTPVKSSITQWNPITKQNESVTGINIAYVYSFCDLISESLGIEVYESSIEFARKVSEEGGQVDRGMIENYKLKLSEKIATGLKLV